MVATSESSVGIFWGPAGRLPSATSARPSRQPPGTTRSSLQLLLPQLSQPPSGTSSPALAPQIRRDGAATSLLGVLDTLLRSIKSDTSTFMKSMRALDSPADNTVHSVGQHGPRYYSPGVAAEDREFFVRECETDADRETALAASALARERHCAVLDKQFYAFDRRKQPHSSKVSKSASRRPNVEEAAATAETSRIDRHRRKIEHLLHVLQNEIANETRREIEFLEYSGPNGPRSRQSRRHMALIIKARYEAADRIMRILEVSSSTAHTLAI
ncbi:hypothetical protein PRIC1_010961 [Phytophthora ramorum]